VFTKFRPFKQLVDRKLPFRTRRAHRFDEPAGALEQLPLPLELQ
jgi:hypothetical protein